MKAAHLTGLCAPVPPQCESSLDGQRGRCWCVNSWNGKKILGSTDLPADAECP